MSGFRYNQRVVVVQDSDVANGSIDCGTADTIYLAEFDAGGAFDIDQFNPIVIDFGGAV